MTVKSIRYSLLLALSSLLISFQVFSQPGYFRDPSLHKDTVVFTADGDLWKLNLGQSKAAVRLTSHLGVEDSSAVSPDGKSLAFVADYSGQNAIYVMALAGGTPEQVSFELSNIRFQGWLDNQHLLYSTAANQGMHSSSLLKILSLTDSKVRVLPLSDAVEAAIDDEDVFFVQFGMQISTDNAHYYKGGAKGELYYFNQNKKKEAVKLTAQHEGSVRSPMLTKERVYFLSNQLGIDNVWSMKRDGSNLAQHTGFKDFPVRKPAIYQNQIVFQHGADIKVLDLATDKVKSLDIVLLSDFPQMREGPIEKPLDYFESASISPDGETVAVIARGQAAVAKTQNKRLVNIPSDQTARLRFATLSKDGDRLYAISDQTGDYEIWSFATDGSEDAKQLTKDGAGYRDGLWLSPDGKTLANTTKSGKLLLLDLATNKNTLIAQNDNQSASDVVFSDDSRWIAYTDLGPVIDRNSVFLYDIENNKGQYVSSDKYNDFSPAFSKDGNWLYFLSDRSFTPTPGHPWGDRNMGAAFNKRTQLFAIDLTKETPFAFKAPTELDENKKSKDDKKESSEEEDKQETPPVTIVWSGIQERLWQVDIPAGDYGNLAATKDFLFLTEEENLKAIGFGHNKELKTVTSGVNNYQLATGADTLLVQKGRGTGTNIHLVPAKDSFPSDLKEHKVNISDLQVEITPSLEFQLLFKDAWLMHRDSLFDPNMRGVNWQQVKQKYMPLVARITERSELNDVFEQMMGELNALHSQVRGGDIQEGAENQGYTTIGGVYEDTADGVKIKHIYQYDKDIISQAPPLAKPEVDAEAGDIILAVNGKKIGSAQQLLLALKNQAGRQVLLELQRGKEKLKTIVVPETSWRESRLVYQDWVARNSQKVSAVDSDIGYLHLYAMGSNDLASFAREFYAQYQKPALIIDVRRNRGGNIDSFIIEKLLRRAWSFWKMAQGEATTNMQQAFRGHLVVLADEFTYSDGETFTAGIKALEIAPVIGKQTAGAGVWLTGRNRLVDGGIARVAEFPVYSLTGDWITEGRGISPDIEVSNPPYATFNGEDAQLKRAIEYLQQKLKEAPVPALTPKPFPAVESSAKDIR
ncbi:S41 family peptidase [Glaciecola sp. 1036]|uniref:S41 family peptidase n=1 Tax=Alteromonadaceae TaxID=72275 RepID=UPI003D05F415